MKAHVRLTDENRVIFEQVLSGDVEVHYGSNVDVQRIAKDADTVIVITLKKPKRRNKDE